MASTLKSKISPHLTASIKNTQLAAKILSSVPPQTIRTLVTEFVPYHIVRETKNVIKINKPSLKENALVTTYANVYSKYLSYKRATSLVTGTIFAMRAVPKNSSAPTKEKRGYIKHLVRLRYRWHFRRELGQFKLFRKFFRRSLKRYRKIQKNRLFVTKFRKNFSKLTGFNEKFIYASWLRFRKGYNQYWSAGNAVLRFSQSLMLAPQGFLVIAHVAPSLAASKHLINSGAISINGATAASFTNFIPGDILQINLAALQGLKALFSYQRWKDGSVIRTLRFIHVDWSSLLFMLLRWPRTYELVAPSFLSERWVRYYIRNFPNKSARFKKISYNTKIYKQLVIKK